MSEHINAPLLNAIIKESFTRPLYANPSFQEEYKNGLSPKVESQKPKTSINVPLLEAIIKKNFDQTLYSPPDFQDVHKGDLPSPEDRQRFSKLSAHHKQPHSISRRVGVPVLVGAGIMLTNCETTAQVQQTQTTTPDTRPAGSQTATSTAIPESLTPIATPTTNSDKNQQAEIAQAVQQTLTALTVESNPTQTPTANQSVANTITAVLAGETQTNQTADNSASAPSNPTSEVVTSTPAPLPTQSSADQPLPPDCNPGDFGILYEKPNYQGIGVRIRQPYTKDLVYEAKNQSNPNADQNWGSFRRCRIGYVVYLYTGTILGGQHIVVDRDFSSFDQTTLRSGEVESSFAILLLRDFPEDRITPPKCPPGALYGLYAEQDYQGESIFFNEEIFNVPFETTGAVVECADAPGSERRALLLRGRKGGASLISESMSQLGSTQITDVVSARPEILEP